MTFISSFHRTHDSYPQELIRGGENAPSALQIFFKYVIYLFMRDTQREAEMQVEGGAGSLQGAQCGDSIPGPRGHDLSQRQMLNHWATQVPPEVFKKRNK